MNKYLGSVVSTCSIQFLMLELKASGWSVIDKWLTYILIIGCFDVFVLNSKNLQSFVQISVPVNMFVYQPLIGRTRFPLELASLHQIQCKLLLVMNGIHEWHLVIKIENIYLLHPDRQFGYIQVFQQIFTDTWTVLMDTINCYNLASLYIFTCSYRKTLNC